MRAIRIIPRLDIKGPNLVKGIHLEGLRALGDPAVFAKYYYDNGADEILLMDVVASLYERNSLHDLIKHISKDIFIPRKPLSASAKRAGWQGFMYNISKIKNYFVRLN